MKKIVGLSVLGVLICATFFHRAQAQTANVMRLGYVASTGTAKSDLSFAGLREGLSDLGHIEGKNILFEYRSAGGEPHRIPELVAELIKVNVDILFCPTYPPSTQLRKRRKRSPLSWYPT
jgi:putative ABC transport system substrate-binding protein